MNYFELHLGDYAKATGHLSILEDGAYSRLLRKYYGDEAPLPADIKQTQRLVGARTTAERKAVEAMLKEFFVLKEDGWHNSRADEEIAAYHEEMVAGDDRRKAESVRQDRVREQRSALFAELAKHSVKPRWNATMKELRAELSRVTGRDSHAPVTDLTRLFHSPIPIHQTPQEAEVRVDGSDGTRPEPPAPPPADDPDDRDRWLACRAAYPPGTYRDNDWLNAERNARACVADGLCHWDQLRAAAVRYADQLRAMGKTRSQFVSKPSAWFHRDARSWDEPFPLPASQGQAKGKAEEVKGSGLPSLN